MIGELEAQVLATLMFENRPMTTRMLCDLLKLDDAKVHKALVMLRREDKVQFIGKNYGWVVK